MTVEKLILFVIECLPLMTFMTTCVGALLTQDKLIRLEFERYPAEWEKDGKPIGSIYRPGVPSFRNTFGTASSGTVLKWSFHPPRWIIEDAEALAALKRYRLMSALSPIALIMFVVAAIAGAH